LKKIKIQKNKNSKKIKIQKKEKDLFLFFHSRGLGHCQAFYSSHQASQS